MPRIEIRDGGTPRAIALPSPAALVGSAPHAAIPVRDDTLGALHFVLREGPDGWWLADLGCAGGTLHNGRPATIVRLAPGDRIEAGRTTILFDPPDGEAAVGSATAPAGLPQEASPRDDRAVASDLPPTTAPTAMEPVGKEPEAVAGGPVEPVRARKRRTGWVVAGFVWGILAAFLAALFLSEEGLVLQVGPFHFKRGSTSQLLSDLILVGGVVICLHVAALGIWLVARRLSPKPSPDALRPRRRGGHAGGSTRRPGPTPGSGPS